MLVIFTISFQFLGNMDLQLQQFQLEISPNLVDFLLLKFIKNYYTMTEDTPNFCFQNNLEPF